MGHSLWKSQFQRKALKIIERAFLDSWTLLAGHNFWRHLEIIRGWKWNPASRTSWKTLLDIKALLETEVIKGWRGSFGSRTSWKTPFLDIWTSSKHGGGVQDSSTVHVIVSTHGKY